MTKGVKWTRSAVTTKRKQRKKQAMEALACESPDLLTQDGESPRDLYEPTDPMDVG